MAIGDFVGKFGSYGTGDGQFGSYLTRLDLDSNYIYVADDSNSRIQIFNINSPYSFVSKIVLGAANYRDPFGIKVDSNYIYWINEVDTRFVKNNKNSPYSNVSNISIDSGMNYQPADIDIDSNYMYIINYDQPPEIRNINPPYSLVGNFGTTGAGSGDGVLYLGIGLNLQGGIAVDNNYIYVANTFNHRVEIFNKNNPYNFVAKFGTIGTGDGQLYQPAGIAVSDLYIYVSSQGTGNMRINVFDKNNPYNFVAKFGSQGTGDGQFQGSIQSIARYDDLIYVAEANTNARIQIFGDYPSFIPGAKGGGGTGGAGGGASGRHIKRRYMGRSLGR